MQSFLSPVLFTIHLMLAAALIGVILLQRSEGGLGGLGGGMSGFMTTRGSTNLLTKTTRWLAAGLMATTLVLAWLTSHPQVTPSISSQPPASSGPTTPPTEPAQSPVQPSPGAPAGGTTGTAPTAPAAPPAVPTNQ